MKTERKTSKYEQRIDKILLFRIVLKLINLTFKSVAVIRDLCWLLSKTFFFQLEIALRTRNCYYQILTSSKPNKIIRLYRLIVYTNRFLMMFNFYYRVFCISKHYYFLGVFSFVLSHSSELSTVLLAKNLSNFFMVFLIFDQLPLFSIIFHFFLVYNGNRMQYKTCIMTIGV